MGLCCVGVGVRIGMTNGAAGTAALEQCTDDTQLINTTYDGASDGERVDPEEDGLDTQLQYSHRIR